MDDKAKGKITSIIVDVNAIARELEEIAGDLAKEFKGIGSAKSAQSLLNAANTYRKVANELKNI